MFNLNISEKKFKVNKVYLVFSKEVKPTWVLTIEKVTYLNLGTLNRPCKKN